MIDEAMQKAIEERYNSFEPQRFFKKIKTRQGQQDYLPARGRIAWLRHTHPDAQIRVELITFDSTIAVVKAIIDIPSTGARSEDIGQEVPSDFGDYLEKATTKSISRACAVLGFGTEMALDLDEEEVADTPASRPASKAPASRPPARHDDDDAPNNVSTLHPGVQKGAANLKSKSAPAEEEEEEETAAPAPKREPDDRAKYGDEMRSWTGMNLGHDQEDFTYIGSEERMSPQLEHAIREVADRNKLPIVNLLRYIKKVEAEAVAEGFIDETSNFVFLHEIPLPLANLVIKFLMSEDQKRDVASAS